MNAWPPQHTTAQCKTVQLFLPPVKLSLPNFSCVPQVLTHSRKSLYYLSLKFSPSSTEVRAWSKSSTTWKKKKPTNQQTNKTTKEAWQVDFSKKKRDWLPTTPDPGHIFNIQNLAQSKILSLC